MADLSPDGRARQAALTRRYVASLPEKKSRIQALWRDAKSGGWRAGDLNGLRVEVHRLAGSAGSYGMDALGQAASRLEAGLKNAAKAHGDGRSATPLAQELLQDLLAAFDQAMDFGTGAPSV